MVYLLVLSLSLQAMGLETSPWIPGQYKPPVPRPSSTGGLLTELAAWWWKKAAAMLKPRSPELEAPCELLEAMPRGFWVKPRLWGKCNGPAVTCEGLESMWSMPWGLAPCELLLFDVAPRGLLDIKPERSTCKLVRSSRTSASLFSWWCSSGLRWAWCWAFISVMEWSAARGAANMLRCSRLRKLRFDWLANSSILEAGGGLTDTSDRSLDASLCCVIAAGDAVVSVWRREQARRWKVRANITARGRHCTSLTHRVFHPLALLIEWSRRTYLARAPVRRNGARWTVGMARLWTQVHIKYMLLLKLITLASMSGDIEW